MAGESEVIKPAIRNDARDTMSSTPAAQTITDELLATLARGLVERATSSTRRFIVGIAGIGGAGKSTLAARLLASVNHVAVATCDTRSAERQIAVLVPMDGFHFANAMLERLNRRQRKGAPDTFDVHAYLALLRQLRGTSADAGNGPAPIPFPIYDRALHEPVLQPEQNAVMLHHRIVITEGNYLLLDEPPWTQLADLLDECWLLDTPFERSRDWILARHVRGGRSPQDAAAHYERCDLANARLVREKLRQPERVLRWPVVVA